jgi:predicted HicB family RNase H-like nuclease
MEKNPPSDETDERTETGDGPKVIVRVLPSQKLAYERAAKKRRKSLSVWVRETLDAAAESLGIQIED